MQFVDNQHPHLLPPIIRNLVAAASWDGETRIYSAAKRKTDRMLQNAFVLKSNCRFRKAGWAKRDEIKRGKEYYNVTLTASLNDVLVSDW